MTKSSSPLYDIANSIRWHFFTTVPTVGSIQRKFRFNKETAGVIQAAIGVNTEKYEDKSDLYFDVLYATTIILLLADKLATDVHLDWLISMRQAGGYFCDCPKMEARHEKELLQLIQNLNLEAFYDAVCESKGRTYRSGLTKKRIMRIAKGYLSIIKPILEPMIRNVSTRRLFHDYEYMLGSGVHRSLQVAMTLNKNDLGVILAKHLDDSWRAEWRKITRKTPVSKVIGVALIEKTFTFLPPVMEEVSLRWIKNPKTRTEVKHDEVVQEDTKDLSEL